MLSGFYGQVSAAATIGGAFWLGGFVAWRENAADEKDPSFDRCENWKKIVARTGKRHMHDTSSQTADSVKPTSLMFFLSAWRLKKNKKKKWKQKSTSHTKVKVEVGSLPQFKLTVINMVKFKSEFI